MQLTKQIKGGDDMEIKVIGTPDEIKKLLNAIAGSKEQLKILDEIKRNTEPLTGDGEKR